jgi:hypothetical protein
MKLDCITGVMHATAPVVARRLITEPRHRVKPVANWASHPGKACLPRPRERFLGRRNMGAQNTPHIGVGSEAEIPGIGVFLAFWALRASDCNGCALVWVSGGGCAGGGNSQSPMANSKSGLVTSFVHLYGVKAMKCGMWSAECGVVTQVTGFVDLYRVEPIAKCGLRSAEVRSGQQAVVCECGVDRRGWVCSQAERFRQGPG